MILVHRAQGRAATQICANDPILLDLRFAPKSPTLRALHKIGQINPQSLSAHPYERYNSFDARKNRFKKSNVTAKILTFFYSEAASAVREGHHGKRYTNYYFQVANVSELEKTPSSDKEQNKDDWAWGYNVKAKILPFEVAARCLKSLIRIRFA